MLAQSCRLPSLQGAGCSAATERVGFSLLLAPHRSASGRRGQAWSWPQTQEQQGKHRWTHTRRKQAWWSGALSFSQSRPDPTSSKVCIPRVSWPSVCQKPAPRHDNQGESGSPWRREGKKQVLLIFWLWQLLPLPPLKVLEGVNQKLVSRFRREKKGCLFSTFLSPTSLWPQPPSPNQLFLFAPQESRKLADRQQRFFSQILRF